MKLHQYELLRSFATLRIKGYKWIAASIHIAIDRHDGDGAYFALRVRALARYYEKHETLPIEWRGGYRKGSSHLEDPDVSAAVRVWLENQSSKEMTPSTFCRALNTTILPELGIALKHPLSHRTARRWLLRMGYQRCVLRKGVYMDGHEREDVVKYRNEVFLPQMKELERRMTQYHGHDLECKEPLLEEGEKRLIPLFHDETCFHASEFKQSVWYEIPIILQRSIHY
jgi:hypothetical protein